MADPLPPSLVAEALAAKARQLGFDLFGIAPAYDSVHADYLREWIARGKHGQMAFLANRLAERISPSTYLPGCKTALCVALNYHVPTPPLTHPPHPAAHPPHPAAHPPHPAAHPPPAPPTHPPTTTPDTPAASDPVPARVARYAWGDDYHEPIKQKLYALADYCRDLVPGCRTRCGVDTAPLPERELAARAGLGWVGKNTCLIHPRLGSWLFLGVVLTTADLPAGSPLADGTGHCGTCTRCLDACPTNALHPDRPYQLDASRCISYLTIEHPGELPPHLAPAIGNWIYGCDICQDVCPHNTKAPPANTADNPFLTPRITGGIVEARAVLRWTDREWHAFSRRTAIRRLGLPLLQRNARQVVANARQVVANAPPTPTPSEPDAPQ